MPLYTLHLIMDYQQRCAGNGENLKPWMALLFLWIYLLFENNLIYYKWANILRLTDPSAPLLLYFP